MKEDKIKSLLASGSSENIKLAILLAQSTDSHFLDDWRALIQLLEKESYLSVLHQDTSIEEQIAFHIDKRELDFSRKKLSKLPKSIGRLLLLECLIVTGKRLTELPSGIGNLTSTLTSITSRE